MSWIHLDADRFVNNVFLSIRNGDRMQLVIRRLFAEVLGKLRLYAHCEFGVHFVAENLEDAGGLRMHHLFIGPDDGQRFLIRALQGRRIGSGQQPNDEDLPEYYTFKNLVSGEELNNSLNNALSGSAQFSVTYEIADKWKPILEVLDTSRPPECRFEFDAEHVLIVRLGGTTADLPVGSLGVAVLWRKKESEFDEIRLEQFISVAKTFGVFLGSLFSGCQSALNIDPLTASNFDPPFFVVTEVVPVVHRRDPRCFV